MDALGTERFFLLRSSFDKYDLIKVSSFSLLCFFFPFLTAAFKAGSVLCAQAGEAEFLNSWLRLPWGSVPPTHPRVRAELGLTHKQLWKCAKCAKCRGDITQAQRGALWGWGNRHKGTGSHPSTPSQASSNILLGSWNPAPLCLLSPLPGLDPPLLTQQPTGTASPNPRGKHLEWPGQRQKEQQPRHQTPQKGTAQALRTASLTAVPPQGWAGARMGNPPHEAELLWLGLLTQDPSGWKSPVRSSSPALNPAMPRPPCPQVPHLHSL